MSNKPVFPEMIYPIAFPGGYTRESLYEYLKGFSLNGAPPKEVEVYLSEDFLRFVYTLDLLPGKHGKLLEIGSNPYFTSLLIKKFTDYHVFYSNYYTEGFGKTGLEKMTNTITGEVTEFNFMHFNVEEEDVPCEDEFDGVLFCEVIEHLTNDPMAALMRLKKSLKPGGFLILSTPNVNRFENVAKMLGGVNIYDPYSGFGPYGRHNREYNKDELYRLLIHLGFEIELMFTTDVHPDHTFGCFDPYSFKSLVEFRKHDLGQYIFVRARNVAPAKTCLPRWLYRSYKDEELCEEGS